MAKESNADKEKSANNTSRTKDKDLALEDVEGRSATGKSLETLQKCIQILDNPIPYSFQGLSSIPKLKGSENWEAWIKALESVARLNGIWNVFTDVMKQPIEPNINEEDLNYNVKMD